jgi:hypothetical protein
MMHWFSQCWDDSGEEFSPLYEAGSATQPCHLCPTVSVLGRDEDVVFTETGLKAFGGPYDAHGEYAWSVVAGTCTLSSKQGSRITAMRDTPGDVRVQVTYSIGENRSEPAFHTIRFVAPPVYVIGAGSAGLKAAGILLGKGYKVVLCEATGAVGGRARTVDALGGSFKVDLGCNWLHGDEWRWELESLPIENLGFRDDDQRSTYPALLELWGFREDVEAVVEVWDAFVKENLAKHSQECAATILGAFDDLVTKPDFTSVKQEHFSRGGKELTHRQVEEQMLTGESKQMVTDLAVSLAREAAAGQPTRDDNDAFLRESEKSELARLVASQERKDVTALRQLRTKAGDAIKEQRRLAFDATLRNMDPEALRAVDTQRRKAYGKVRQTTLELCEKKFGNQNEETIEKRFTEMEGKFDDMCRLAYEIVRAQEGPLEEALEYEQFSNHDRDGGPIDVLDEPSGSSAHSGSDGDAEPVHKGSQKRKQSGANVWYLGGYGGLLVSYANHLKKTYGAKLWIRRNTAVASVCYDQGKLPQHPGCGVGLILPGIAAVFFVGGAGGRGARARGGGDGVGGCHQRWPPALRRTQGGESSSRLQHHFNGQLQEAGTGLQPRRMYHPGRWRERCRDTPPYQRLLAPGQGPSAVEVPGARFLPQGGDRDRRRRACRSARCHGRRRRDQGHASGTAVARDHRRSRGHRGTLRYALECGTILSGCIL